MADYVTLHDPVTCNAIYPLTHPAAVRDGNGISIESRLNKVEEDLSKVSVPEATVQQIIDLFNE